MKVNTNQRMNIIMTYTPATIKVFFCVSFGVTRVLKSRRKSCPGLGMKVGSKIPALGSTRGISVQGIVN